MASYDKNKRETEARKIDETIVTEVAMAPDKEKLVRHDRAHWDDLKLAASLRAKWADHVKAEHNYH